MYRRITASCIILFMLFSDFRNEDLERTGFLGKSVTLPSGVTEPGTIAIIEWSIFTNQTYIAGFSGGHVNVPNNPRMELNKITGDLLIRDLRKEDSGTYTVRVRITEGRHWVNKITLFVKEELPEPKITVINSTVQHGMCNIFLMCSLKSKNTVTFTYGPEGFPHGCEFKPLRYVTAGQEAEAWCSPIQDVNITCTANDSVSTTASTVTIGCLGKNFYSVGNK
uniref:SLAM family member 5-like n=1 Tax=Paramormyrops kingsleyae TaxID=1676925 RepID=A0A3B3THI1_9TELE|nr:SLAM family member 5-like isoform X2 [Paramormyrops kingsleyae]